LPAFLQTEVSLQIQSDLLATHRELTSTESQLAKSLAMSPEKWSTNDVITLQRKVKALKEVIIEIQQLHDLLFPANEE